MSSAPVQTGLDLVINPRFAEAAIWRRYKIEGDASVRPAVFARYKKTALVIARGAWRRAPVAGLERRDYEQFAFQGLLEAIDAYDPLRGIPFEAYARHRVAGAIRDGRKAASESSAQSSHKRRMDAERLRAIKSSLQRTDEDDPLAKASSLITMLALSMLLDEAARAAPAGDQETLDPPDAYQSVAWRDLLVSLNTTVNALTDPERTIIRLHYFEGLSLVQVAALAGLSGARISQLHQSALHKIRAAL